MQRSFVLACAIGATTLAAFNNTADAGAAVCDTNFNYSPDFGGVEPPGLTFNGNASFTGGNIILTPFAPGQAGSVWHTASRTSLADGFDTTFNFYMDGNADGIAFVIQDEGPNALGDGGSGLGYASNGPNGGITRSLAVEIDTFCFGEEFNCDHLSIQTNGTAQNQFGDAYSLGHVTLPIDVNDGSVHTLRIVYVPGTLAVFFEGDSTPILTVGVDLTDINGESIADPDGCMLVGFTGGTGGAVATQAITAWTFTDTAEAPPTGCNADFVYQQFNNPRDFNLKGSAYLDSGSIILTDNTEGQSGAAWYRLARAHAFNAFTTEFGFTLQGQADGIAFVLQSESLDALGDGGSGIGYQGITSSLAIEIDTFCFEDEFACDHISIQTDGPNPNQSSDTYSISHLVLPNDLNDGNMHVMRIEYTVGSLTIYLDGKGLGTGFDINNLNILDPDGCLYIGFTGATGAATATQSINYWAFNPAMEECVPVDLDSADFGPGNVTTGSPIVMSVVASGTPPFTYQWYRDSQPLTDGGNITGSNTDTLTIDPVTTGDSGQYDISVNNKCGGVGTGIFKSIAPACPGDADSDGDVDFADITAVLTAFNFDYLPGTGPGDADVNGIVNFADITAVLTNFGSHCD
ncbi:MAG: immunoglobulin domain-containing protein [Phycisphaerae bacterium]|nr:immunoglobulin domain-containing protein [Phycisphaerae bacterium]